MKITDRFIGDHKTFRKLMKDVDGLAERPAPDQRRLVRLVELFVDHLILHAWGEETFYYPCVATRVGAGPLTPEYLQLLDEEHVAVDAIVKRLETEVKSSPINPNWTVSYENLKRDLIDHMRKEEEELFPLSEQLLGAAALENISKTLETRRSEAPKIRLHSRF